MLTIQHISADMSATFVMYLSIYCLCYGSTTEVDLSIGMYEHA